MQHGSVPLEDSDARLQQWPIPGPRERSDKRHINGSRDQQADIHAVLRCRFQDLDVERRADEVGIGEPERPTRARGDKLVESIELRRGRRTGHYAGHHRAGGRNGALVRQVVRRKRRACGLSCFRKCQFDIRDRWSLDDDSGVTPRFDATFGIPHPRTTDAQTGDERQPPIDRENLAMVSTDPPEGPVESRGIEGSDLDARPSELRPAAP